MTTNLLLAIVGLVGAIGLVNLVLIFGVIGRVRALQDLVPPGALRDPLLPEPGDAVGSFQITTQDGDRLSEAALQGEPALVGFFVPGCRLCGEVRAQLLAHPPALRVISFVEGTTDDPEVVSILQSMRSLGPVAAFGPNDDVGRAFKPSGFPTLIRTKNGNVTAAGHRLSQVL